MNSMVRPGASSDISYRADIDGLRAIAVLAVVGFHVNLRSLSGGFVGVDIFFVISGFLISQLIISGLKKGTFSFFDFYARRCRRLFPALVAVLVATWGIAWFISLPSEFVALAKQIVAGAVFAANILFYAEVGYFDTPAVSKPLLHLWSLGVEEQFYIVFPALLFLLWRLVSIRKILVAIAASSFLINIVAVHVDAAFAFYMPFTRFWEFLAGALLAHAITIPPYVNWGSLKRFGATPTSVSALGFLLVAMALYFIPKDAAFPGWWALLPTIGTVLIIAGSPEGWLNRHVLVAPPVVYVGRISYPLYLWHWPLIVVSNAITQSYGLAHLHRVGLVCAVVASFILATLTYEFIERPIRERKSLQAMRRVAIGSAACLVPVIALGLATLGADGFPIRLPKPIQSLMVSITLGADYPPPNTARNTTGPMVVTFGDSHANHLQPGLRVLQNERTFRLAQMNWGNCPPMGYVLPPPDAGTPKECEKVRAAYEQEFQRLKPDTVIIGAFWWQYRPIEGIEQVVSFLKKIGVRRIVLMGSAPFWPTPPQTLLYETFRANPSGGVPDRLTSFNHETIDVDRRLKQIAEKLGIGFIPIYDVFCNDQGCLVRLGDKAKDIVQPDLTHFSAEGSWYLISHVADQIFAN